MEYCKLQIGCLLVLLYILIIYFKEKKRFHIRGRFSMYDALLLIGFVNLILDAITAYTVNHPDMVSKELNMILHGLFLISIDTLIFAMFLYMLSAAEGLPAGKRKRFLLCAPFFVNICVVVFFLKDLEYRSGKLSNYSMGISAYTCFIMASFYILLTLALMFRRWNYIQSHKRFNMISCLVVLIGVTGYQMIFPDALISGVAAMMVILGAYMNQEDPAMQELLRYHEEMVMGFATLIENRDENTGGHVKRTTQYVKLLTEELRSRGYYRRVLTKDYMRNILMAAPMHDIGKIAVPDAILQKPDKLTAEEFEKMKLHASKGGEIIRQTFSRMGDRQYMEIAYNIAMYHHEKWNGKGYPAGLKRKEIPLCARIMAIADVFDAVSQNRCYRKAMPLEQCFDIISEGSGQDFDPLLAEVFLDIKDKVEMVYRQENDKK
ncbi:MAG: HD domain-containing protein [Lachnospiraceae bacterium]|nr:HD domain-containing protein [Lachnospiraceae bacterium]